jgi:hypothetical protein
MAKSPVPPEFDVALVTPPDGRITTVWWEWLQRYIQWDEACCAGGDGGGGGTGPAGPAGPAGPTGPTGATGSPGVGVPIGGTSGQVLAKIDATNYNTQWTTPSGGGGTPGGATTQVQFNDGGAFAGDTALTWNKTTDALTLTGIFGIGIAPNATYPLLVHAETDANLALTGHSTQIGVQLRAMNDAGTLNAYFEFQATDYQFLTGPVAVKNSNLSIGGTSGALVVTGDIATGNKVNALLFNVRGSTSGDAAIRAQGAVTSYNFNLPLTAGTAGQVLTSQGGVAAAMTWTTPTAYAPLASPVFTGDPQAPTASVGDSDTSIATTAFVQSAVATTFTGGMSTAEYTYSTTVGGTPSTGQLRANTTTQNAITSFYLHETNAVGVDITNALKLILSGVKVLVQDKTNAANVQYYQTTGPAVDNGTYFTIPVAWTSTGSGSSFTAGRVIFAGFGIGSNNMPEAPTDGQIYGRRGSDTSWQVAGDAYLPLTGGTLTGRLNIKDTVGGTNTALVLDSQNDCQFYMKAQNAVWKNRFLAGGDVALQIDTMSDAGAVLVSALKIDRLNGATTLTGDLTISKASPTLTLNKPALTTPVNIYGTRAGVSRWSLHPGDGGAESGSNTGSDFRIGRYDDAGTLIDWPLYIARTTGVVTATGLPPIPKTGTGVGQWTTVASAVSAAGVLPAGGTWSWFGLIVASPAGNTNTGIYAGVGAGGASVMVANTGYINLMVCWRIA